MSDIKNICDKSIIIKTISAINISLKIMSVISLLVKNNIKADV